MRNIDLSSWQSVLTTVIGIALLGLIGVGVRLLVMFSVQQRRERMNRQINERLKTLIAAYKVLGGSFTGDLTVDPTHRRDQRGSTGLATDENAARSQDRNPDGSDRRRRIRDAVEAALSDIILLGTEEQVRLADRAARELVADRPVQTHELVVSLRNFIRKALDIDPVPSDLAIPAQGPARPSASGGRGQGERGGESARKAGGGAMGGGGAGGMTGGMGMGATPDGHEQDDPASPHHP